MDFNCEFNAPMFVDFQNMDGHDQNPEAYFDIDHENPLALEAMKGQLPEEPPFSDEQPPKEPQPLDEQPPKEPQSLTVAEPANGPPSNSDEKPPKERLAPNEEPSKDQACSVEEPQSVGAGKNRHGGPKNVVSSWEESGADKAKPRRSGGNLTRKLGSVDTPSRQALRNAVRATIEEIKGSPKLEVPKQKEQSPALSRWRKAVSQMTPEVIKKARLRMTARPGKDGSNEQHRQGAGNDDFKQRLAAARKGLRSGSQSFSSTDRGIALPASGPLAPTNPIPFHFATDARFAHKKPVIGRPDAHQHIKDMDHELKKYDRNGGSKPAAKTAAVFSRVPSFRTRNRSADHYATVTNTAVSATASGSSCGPKGEAGSDGPPSAAYMSVAEQIRKFQTGTPERFRSRPRWRSASPARSTGTAPGSGRLRSPSPNWLVGQNMHEKRALTKPQTPLLMTRDRARPTTALSRQQQEEMELEEAKKHMFKASGINQGLPTAPQAAVAEREQRKALTKPKPFNFATSSRAMTKDHLPPNLEEEKSLHNFRAAELNRKILEGPSGIPQRKVIPPVHPESPAFALAQRLEVRNQQRKRLAEDALAADQDHGQPSSKIFRAHSEKAIHNQVPIVLQNVSKQRTVAEPFSFASRDAELMEKKAKKIEAILEEERRNREFKANPVPNMDRPAGLPMKEVLEPTEVKPFELRIEKRVEERIHKFQQDVENELLKQREAANFKAHPVTVFDKQPFVPKPSTKPLCQVENFELHCDRRAAEREAFEERTRQREADLEAQKRATEEQKRLDEEHQVQQLRQQAVHKAQPIRHYKSILIHPSEAQLTTPVSPKFTYKSRSSTAPAQQNETFDI